MAAAPISPQLSELGDLIDKAQFEVHFAGRAAHPGVARLSLGQCRDHLLRGIAVIETARAALEATPKES